MSSNSQTEYSQSYTNLFPLGMKMTIEPISFAWGETQRSPPPVIPSSEKVRLVILKQADCGADKGSPPLCSHVRCNVRSCSLACSACSSCTSGSLLSQECCSNPTFSEGCTKGTFVNYQYDRKQTAALVMLLNSLIALTHLLVNWMSCASSRHCRRDSLFSSRMAAQMKSSKVKSVLMACSSDSGLSSAKKRQRPFTLTFNRN